MSALTSLDDLRADPRLAAPAAPTRLAAEICSCGAVLHAHPAGDEWTWRDVAGRAVVDLSPAGYSDNPRQWWADLAEADIAAYSALTCRADLGMLGWQHVHRPATPTPWPAPVPSCCGMPMRLTPAGWACRERCAAGAAPAGAAIPPLREIPAPTLRVVGPNGEQMSLPGVLWPNVDAWMASADANQPAPIEVRLITRECANGYLERWHDLGRETRCYGRAAFALVVFGQVLAVATSGSTVSKSVDQSLGLTRLNTIELTRICRSEDDAAKGVLRVMLRLWRDFLAVRYRPKNTKAVAPVALVTYSMPGRLGALYRFDGWTRVRGCRPWGGGATWSGPSRADHLGSDKALWVYRIPAGAAQ